MLELDLLAAYWRATGGRKEPAASLRSERRPTTVTASDGTTRVYRDGTDAAREWPTERVAKRRGGYFERRTRQVKRPDADDLKPPPVPPGWWADQERQIRAMYVDLRPGYRGDYGPGDSVPEKEGEP